MRQSTIRMKVIPTVLCMIGVCALVKGLPNTDKENDDVAVKKIERSTQEHDPPVIGPPTPAPDTNVSRQQGEIVKGMKVVAGPPTPTPTQGHSVAGQIKAAVSIASDNGNSPDRLSTCTCTCQNPDGETEQIPTCTCTCPSKSLYKDCKDAYARGRRDSGVYTVRPRNSDFKVYCDMTTDGGGWSVFQRRKDGSVSFHRNWNDYVNGFGDLNGEFWLGLRYINDLTGYASTELRVDFTNSYAKYSYFSVGDEVSKYLLTDSGYSGNAGDALSYHNGQKFSTIDQDNDNYYWGSCASSYNGGWWYNSCSYANPNGDYSYGSGVVWWWTYSTFDEMKVRRN